MEMGSLVRRSSWKVRLNIIAYSENTEIIDPEAEVERIFKECDKNQSGFIDYTGNSYFAIFLILRMLPDLTIFRICDCDGKPEQSY